MPKDTSKTRTEEICEIPVSRLQVNILQFDLTERELCVDTKDLISIIKEKKWQQCIKLARHLVDTISWGKREDQTGHMVYTMKYILLLPKNAKV